jgi:hypothetical protein
MRPVGAGKVNFSGQMRHEPAEFGFRGLRSSLFFAPMAVT